MKRLISLLLVLSLMFSGLAVLAEGEENPNFNIDYEKNTWFSGIFNVDGKILCLRSNTPSTLYELNIEEKKLVEHKELVQNDEVGYLEMSFMSDGKLHAIYYDENKIYELEEKDGKLSPKKLVGKIQKKSEHQFANGSRVLAVGKKLYYSLVDYSESKTSGSVLEYDMESGKTTKILKDIYGTISEYKDGKLLICYVDSEKGDKNSTIGTAVIYSYDTKSKKLEEIHSFTIQNRYRVSQVFYNPVLDGVFYIENGKVFKVIDKKEAEYVAKVPFGTRNPFVLPDGRVIVNDPQLSQFCVRKLDPKFVPQKELVVLNGGYNKAFKVAEEKMNGVAFAYKTMSWGKPEEMAQSIISAKDSWDMMVAGTYIDVESLVKKGYIEPINSEKLKASMDRAWEAYTYGTSFDGKLYAVPMRRYSDSLYYSKTMFERLKLEKPKTLGDLLDLKYKLAKNQIEGADKYKLFDDDGYLSIQLIISMYVNQMLYENKDLSFDTPEFRELIEKFFRNKKEIKAPKQSEDEYMEDERLPLIRYMDVLDPSFYNMNMHEADEKVELLALSAVEGLNPVISMGGQMIVVNAQSKNKELAFEALEKMLESYSDKEKAQLYKDWSEPVVSEDFESIKKQIDKERELVLKKLEEAKTEAEKKEIEDENPDVLKDYDKRIEREKYSISKENLEEYQKLMKENEFRMLSPSERAYFGQDVITKDLYKRIEAGKMTTDQFIREIENKIKLIKLERK